MISFIFRFKWEKENLLLKFNDLYRTQIDDTCSLQDSKSQKLFQPTSLSDFLWYILKVEFPKTRQNKSKLVCSFQYYSCPNQFKPVCRDFRASFWSPSSDSLKTLNDVWFSEILLLAVYCILLPFCFLTNFFFSFFMVFFSI